MEHLQQLLSQARGGSNEPFHISPASSAGALPVIERDGAGPSTDEHLALDDAENPLQLLARASDLRLTSPHSGDIGASTPSSRTFASDRGDKSDVHRFFLPVKANLDQGPDLDPIDLGLVTMEEAEMLISL